MREGRIQVGPASDERLPPIHPVRRWVNTDLAVLALLLLLFTQVLRPHPFLPVHETLTVFQGFHYFYSNVFHVGELPRWCVYGTYGTPSALWQLLYLTPASYAAMAVGRLLRMQNVLAVFDLSLFIEQVILLVGVYKLSRLLYARRHTAYLVCIGAMGSAVWYSQVWWNFRIAYTLPLMLYFLISFFTRRRPWYLWLTGMTFVVSLLGNLTCFAVVWLLVLGAVAAVLTWKDASAWRSLGSLSTGNLVSLAAFLGLGAAYLAFLHYAHQNIQVGFLGRDPSAAPTPLETCFTQAEPPDALTLFRLFLFGWPLREHAAGALENTVYVGLLPLPLAVYALVKVRKASFLALVGAAGLLLWVARSGGLSETLSDVPGLSVLVRHGAVYGVASLLILLCAGFGMEQFLKEGTLRQALAGAAATLFLADCFVDKYVMSSLEWTFNLRSTDWWNDVGWFWGFLVRLGAYAALGVCTGLGLVVGRAILGRAKAGDVPSRGTGRRLAAGALVAVYALDLMSFRAVVAATAPRVAAQAWGEDYAAYSDAVGPGTLPFPSRRIGIPRSGRPSHALHVTWWLQEPDRVAESIYGFAQYDPWASYPYLSVWSVGPRRLFESRGRKPEKDPAFARILACDESKFRLLSNPTCVDSLARARELVKKTQALDQRLILRGVPPDLRPAGPVDGEGESGTVHLVRGTANEVTLEAQVVTDAPTWLVYADAFHPGWRAEVNGREVTIAEAYLAFKAVPVKKGKNVVRFAFDRGWGPKMAGVLQGVGWGFCGYVLVSFVLLFFSPPRSRAGPDVVTGN